MLTAVPAEGYLALRQHRIILCAAPIFFQGCVSLLPCPHLRVGLFVYRLQRVPLSERVSGLRYDFYQWGANDNKAHAEELFTIQDANWEFNFIVHPSGDYVYMMVQNQHYILRSNYDRVNKRLTTPYIVCGQPGQADYSNIYL